MMNVASMLAPVAYSTIGTAAQQVAGMVQSGVSFASALQARTRAAARSTTGVQDRGGPEQGPEQTHAGDQVQRSAIRQSLESLRVSVHDRLRERFARQGIDVSEPVVLAADGHGRVLEAGGHWDRAQIEELLARDSVLRDQVSLLLQQAARLYQGSQAGTGGSTSSQLRLVMGETEIFFQVVER